MTSSRGDRRLRIVRRSVMPAMISASRPKKIPASSSSNAERPGKGPASFSLGVQAKLPGAIPRWARRALIDASAGRWNSTRCILPSCSNGSMRSVGCCDRSTNWRSAQRERRGSSFLRSRRIATMTSLPRSSARLSSRWHSLLSSASGEASSSTASHEALALRSVSRQRSPAPIPCRSMNTSSAAQPLAISQRWNASASTLSFDECEMNKRGKIRPHFRAARGILRTRPWRQSSVTAVRLEAQASPTEAGRTRCRQGTSKSCSVNQMNPKNKAETMRISHSWCGFSVRALWVTSEPQGSLPVTAGPPPQSSRSKNA